MNVQTTIELFENHEIVKFILPSVGETECKTIEFKDVIQVLEKQMSKKSIENKVEMNEIVEDIVDKQESYVEILVDIIQELKCNDCSWQCGEFCRLLVLKDLQNNINKLADC